jgi:hypothetical protein
MNWKKINIQTIIDILREFEKNTMAIDAEYAVVFSDGKDEIKISYKNLEK